MVDKVYTFESFQTSFLPARLDYIIDNDGSIHHICLYRTDSEQRSPYTASILSFLSVMKN